MKLSTLKGHPNMGKVWNDDKTICYAPLHVLLKVWLPCEALLNGSYSHLL